MAVSVSAQVFAADFYQPAATHNLLYTEAASAVERSSPGYVLSYLTQITWGFSSFHYGLLAYCWPPDTVESAQRPTASRAAASGCWSAAAYSR